MSSGSVNDTVLINAALNGHEECLKTAIKSGADVNCADNKSKTPLMTSAQLGHDQCVHILINEGADVNKMTSHFTDGSTALIFASAEGHKNCMDLLLKAGADVNIEAGNSYTYTALSKAAENGHSACLKVLLIETTQICPTVKWKNQAQGKSVEKGHTACAELLLKSGADVNVVTEIWSGYTPLMKASKAGNFNCVELLLRSGADVNRIDTRSSSALIKASASSTESSASSAESCISALIKAGADVNVCNEAGETAVLHCARNSVPVDGLIQAGADVNIPTKNKGSTPLLEAVQVHKKGLTERILNSLIQAGADVNFVSANGETALMKSVSCGNMSNIRLLLKGGCKMNLLDKNDKHVFNYLDQFMRGEEGRKTRDVTKRRLFSLLSAAGAEFHQNRTEYFTEFFMYLFKHMIEEQLEVKLCLKQICRKMIRTHLLEVNADGNLFVLVPRLGLPSILASHLLYYVSLDSVKAKEKTKNNGLKMQETKRKASRSRKRRATKRWRKNLNLRNMEHDRTFRNRVVMNLKL